MQTFNPSIDGYHDVAFQVTLDLRRRAQEHFRRQEREKRKLTTLEALETHNQRVRENFIAAIGGLPSERTPLSPRITGAVEREKFRVEKLIYESIPSFPVTAALYLPRESSAKPCPAVVFVHGHADNGKSYQNYQKVCIDLAENGFVVLAIDPPGQGERHLFIENGQRLYHACTYEHTYAGIPFWLRGASVARHFIWDVMRGIDYLETRPEVDAARIGITGSSGGGLQTCYLMLCEPRLAAAVPCTFVMMLEDYQKTGQPQDAEQIIPGCMVAGPNHDDFLTVFAPRPVLVGAAAYDFFPIEGAHEAVRRAKRAYALYGKEENVAIQVAPTTHQYSAMLRQACVNWFKLHLRGEEPDFVTADPEPFEEEELWTTKSGEVLIEFPEALTIAELNERELPTPPADRSPAELRAQLQEVLSTSEAGDRDAPIYARIIRDQVVSGYRTEKLYFFSAPDIAVTGVLVHPRGEETETPRPTTLLLLEHGTDDIPASRPRIEKLLRQGQRVLVFDVRGVGALKEHSRWSGDEFEIFNHEYKLGCDAIMLGLSTLGLRVYDVLRGYNYLRTRTDVGAISLHGVGSGAVFAFFAAVLEENFACLTCEEMLASYREICCTPNYQLPHFNLKSMAYGLLQVGDFNDFLPALAPRPVSFIRPRNAHGEVME